MKPVSAASTLTDIDALIVRGQGLEARKAIEARAKASRLTRTELAPLAGLAWRAGLPELGLKLLHAVVRPAARKI